MKKFKFAMIVVVAMIAVNTEATIIDFEILGAGGDDGPTYLGTSVYAEDGYTLNTDGEFGFIRLTETDSIGFFSGAQADTISIVKDDGGSFDLLSIDYRHVDSLAIEFTGVKTDSSVVYFFKEFDAELIYSTVFFADFTDIVSLSWENGGGYNHFDNIIVVPEPSTLFLFTLGTIFLKKRF